MTRQWRFVSKVTRSKGTKIRALLGNAEYSHIHWNTSADTKVPTQIPIGFKDLPPNNPASVNTPPTIITQQRLRPRRRMRLSMKILYVIYVVSLLFVVGGVLIGVYWSKIYDHLFHSQLSLRPGSTNYKMWKKTPIPMYLKLYMFNWTNPQDFNSTTSEKPNFVEMGPYVFRQVDYKVNDIWNDNGTVTYQRKRVWHFDKSLSAGSLSDKVTNLDPVAVTVAYTLRYQTTFFRDVVNRALEVLGHRRSVTKTVGELLFEGYNDTMLLIARKLNLSTIPYTKFGWFYQRNESDTYDGTFNMLTGVDNLLEMGMLQEWNFKSRSTYPGSCGKVKGSNGELWPPLPDNKTIPIFVSDICTDLQLQYDKIATHEGLTGKKYVSDERMLDNGDIEPSRRCYCAKDGCLPKGVLNVSACKYGAPAFVSLPHFYLADPSYRDNITGMNPSKEKHEMSLLIEPTTGIPLRVKAQLQLNLMIQPDNVMSLFKNINTTFIPMLWFTQEANLTSEYASKVKLLLTLPSFGLVTALGTAAIGGFIFLIGIFLFIRRRWQDEEGQLLLARNDNHDVNRISG